MKIAWLCTYPPENLAKIPVSHRKKRIHPATWVVNLAQALVERYSELELHIITETPLISRSFSSWEKGMTFHVLRDESAVPFMHRGWPPYLPLHLLSRYRLSQRKMISVLRKINPDVVHAHGTEMAYALAAVNSGFPNIISIQGLMHKLAEHYPDNRTFRLRVPMEREVLEKGRFFISKTPFAREFIEEMNPAARIFDIENTMHPAFFEVKPDYRLHRRLLFIGTMVEAKGVRELFEAVSRIDSVTLVVVGQEKGGLAEELRNRYAHLNVEWKGFLSSEQIAEEMNRVDMLVLPSYMDTSPNVVSEAMCAGLPVVATRVGGIPNMIEDGRTGLLVPAKEVEPLAIAINSLLNDTALKERLGRSAREEAVNRFSPKTAASKVRQAYETVIRGWMP
jgi:glycosyltransferase involved in cell wall biosynthesis